MHFHHLDHTIDTLRVILSHNHWCIRHNNRFLMPILAKKRQRFTQIEQITAPGVFLGVQPNFF